MYIKLNKQKIDNLINFCKYNFDADCSNSCNGVIILSKTNHIKQIIIDYQNQGIQDYVIHHKNDHKLDFLKLINNKDPNYHMVISFDISNKFDKKNNFNSYPSIYEFIKCCVYSIYRKVFNHLYINPYGKKYIISLKKHFLFELLGMKKKDKLKMKDFISRLFSIISKIYNNNNHNNYSLSEEIYEYFNINEFDKDINILYKFYNII
tara:strand:- start:791 stop:1411 length:621 start_codon:yes stop_codon:yes gene_type:complete